ncbi:MAG: DUF5312 domain-containing protein [Treponema sp.]|jgi:hypothetical protein|nr:DUF5312 domain-containing protein [Treponema sp.]
MNNSGNFSRLVEELGVEERARLLEKLTGQSNLPQTPLYEDQKEEPAFKLEARYQSLPWYQRLWFYILSFFNTRSPLKLYEDHVMTQVASALEEKFPGLYHFQKDLLLPKFQQHLVDIRDGSRFFYSALDASLNRDRGGLLVFLGSLEMPAIHQLVETDTDPAALAEFYQDLGEGELRLKSHRALEDALAGITEEQRAKMYDSARSLYCLKQLSSFLFDRMINAFFYDSTHQGNICPAASVRDQLLVLNNILVSMREPPPLSLLESLFVYVLTDRAGEQGFDMQQEMRKLLVQAEASIETIRDFNRGVPLTQMLRCMSRNMGISPRNIGGGEDWFTVFRDCWKARVDERLSEFIKTRRQKELQNSFRYFLRGTSLKLLDHMYSEANTSGMEVRGNFSLSFLQTFYTVVFMGDINKVLRPILIDGDFIRRENRTEFTESYNNLIKLEDIIRRYDRNISPSGDYGKRYYQAKSEMTSLPVKRRKIQMVMEEASRDAVRILDQTREAISGMIRILGGILRRSVDGKYDTLTNFSVVAGARVDLFNDGVTETINQFRKALQLLDEIDVMDAAR